MPITTTTTTTRAIRTDRRCRGGLVACVTSVALALPACRSDSPFEAALALPPPPGAARPLLAPPPQTGSAGATAPVDAPATLAAYLEHALRRHPALRRARAEADMLAERPAQARSLDDPMLSVSPIGEMAETAAGAVGTMTSVSQTLPWPGKLAARAAAAEARAAAATARVAVLRLQIAADVHRAYWRIYAADRALEALDANRTVLNALYDLSLGRAATGRGSQSDTLQLQVAVSDLETRAVMLTQQRRTAAALLNRLMDRPLESPVPSPPVAPLPEVPTDFAQMLPQLRHDHPELRALRRELDAQREALRLAKLADIPDLTVSFIYNFVEPHGLAPAPTGDDQWGIGFGINLPLWRSRIDAAKREARHAILRAMADHQDAEGSLALDLRVAWLDVASHRAQAMLLETRVLPETRQAIDAAMAEYRGGSGDFATVAALIARQLAFQTAHASHVAEAHRALAEARLAAGRDPARVAEPPRVEDVP